MKSLYRSYEVDVSNAYIIYLPNNTISVDLANRCLESCKKINYSATLYEGFDGTGDEIKVPTSLKDQSWYRWLKVTDHQQSLSEIACSLSHISLWAKCMEEDRPIVILEHDAIMIRPYKQHVLYNGIAYLGCNDDLKKSRDTNSLLPWFSSINKNWHFINRAHAYAIDPPAARKLFINVMDRGIFESADVMIKADDVAIIQNNFYAYDLPGETTITQRKI